MTDSLWDQWRGRVPTAQEIDLVRSKTHEAIQFAITSIDLVLVRLSDLSARPTIDPTELDSVTDELRVARRELAAKASRL